MLVVTFFSQVMPVFEHKWSGIGGEKSAEMLKVQSSQVTTVHMKANQTEGYVSRLSLNKAVM